MTPEERQLITGLFDRMRGAGAQQRDREAEGLIGDLVRQQPYAPYLLSQTVIVQDQALQAANRRIQELEAQVQHQPQQQDTSFLGGLGRSIFGQQEPPRQSVPAPAQDPYRGQQQGGPWGGGAQQGAQQGGPWGGGQGGGFSGGGAGGGFLKGALGAAAGVAGGVLLADGIRNLFAGHNNPYGIASGFGDLGGGFMPGGGETVINNFYGNAAEPSADFGDPGGDVGGGGDYSGGDYSSDV